MQNEFPLKPQELEPSSISAFKGLGAYEALLSQKGMSFKTIPEMRRGPESGLSDFVDESEAYDYAKRARDLHSESGINEFGVRVYGTWEYPSRLHDAAYPLELLYFQGIWDDASTQSRFQS